MTCSGATSRQVFFCLRDCNHFKSHEFPLIDNVRVKEGDNTVEADTEEGIFNHVSKHLSERFRLAFTAKCYSGQLFDDIGFIGDTENARAILESTYVSLLTQTQQLLCFLRKQRIPSPRCLRRR